MSIRSWLPALLALLLLVPSTARAERPIEDDVRELLKVTGAEQQARQMGRSMADALRPMAPSLPPELWDELFSDASLQVLADRMIPLYVEAYSPEDLRALLAFYRSPLGQRFVAKAPEVQRRAFEIGQQWGIEVGRRVAAEAQAREAASP